MKLNKKILILLCAFLSISSLSARAFEEYILTPKLGVSLTLPTGKEHVAFQAWHAGPSIDFDAKFNHKSGFSFLITNSICSIIDMDLKPPTWKFQPSPFLSFLFGYTYGVGQNFQITAAAGISLALSFTAPSIPVQLDFSYFFTKEYGICCSLTNNFIIGIPYETALETKQWLNDFIEISVGANFRL